ncbi:alpha/beta hydrolase [Neolewinella persica]|uniref:alpha/beta hydrolase n=1 Tax=Neolewinella persica TaxID=70998 RepID=UPI0003783E8A|nr:alpha/beta hydrolase [Neolewinella persica]
MKIYLIPGLGYDHRIFEGLPLADYEVECLNWLEPRKHEVISDYSLRLFDGVPADEDIVLIGHSIGGVIAQEIAAKRKIRKVILISSVQSRGEIPGSFRLVKPLGLYRLMTKELTIKTVKYWGGSNGLVSDADKDLFKSMISGYSNSYLQWALKELSGWQSAGGPSITSIFRIHGTEDKTFPIIGLIAPPDVVIEGGSHFMVHAEAEQVGKAVIEALRVD